MTLQQIVEQIRQIFPNVGETQVKMDVNKVYLDYANKTGLCEDYYDEEILPNTVKYYISSDVNSIEDIKFFDASGKELSGVSALKFSITQGEITFYSYYGRDISSIPSSISKITYYYKTTPQMMTDDSETPNLPAEFHDALVEGVLKDYFAKFQVEKVLNDGNVIKMIDLNLAQYHDKEYRTRVIEGKKYSLKNRNGLSIHINSKGF